MSEARSTLRRRGRRFRLLAGVLIFGAVGAIFVVACLNRIAARLPSVENIASIRLNRPTTILSSDGVTLASLRLKDTYPIPLSKVSPHAVDATVAVEDARFYEHGAIDPRGIVRALWRNLLRGDALSQGGSTITQQLARSLYLSNEKSFRRKIEEMLLAGKIERAYSKRQILEAYLNTVYYGGGAYGIESAARRYFGKSARNLNLGEAALLAGLPQRPAAYTPTQNLEAALRRRDQVLNRMVATGKVTAEQANAARRQRVRLLPAPDPNGRDWKAPYFVAQVIARLKSDYGSDFLYSGARVETTLNWRVQQAAEKAMRAGLRRGIANTGALVAIEPKTGAVRALIGGPDFQVEQFDAATNGVRQPGSAFKPFVYAAAFDKSLCSLISRMEDRKLVLPSVTRDYVVRNHDHLYRGGVSVLAAIRNSINTVAVKVAEETGLSEVAACAKQLGIRTPLQCVPSLALGASGVRPIDLCSAYSAFANGGDRYEPALITRITDTNGETVYQDDPEMRYHASSLARSTVDQINAALREVVLSGTGRTVRGVPDAHGKTGTTNSRRDAWFVGYTGELATAVWMARRSPPSGRNAASGPVTYLPMPRATGGGLCGPVWRDFMVSIQPVLERIAARQGRLLREVGEPPSALLCASLAEALRSADQVASDAELREETQAVAISAAFQPAQYGSGPIIVTAPDTAETEQPTDGEATSPEAVEAALKEAGE